MAFDSLKKGGWLTRLRSNEERPDRSALILRGISLSYVGLFVGLPIVAISTRAFSGGLQHLWSNITQPEALFSLRLTFFLAVAMIMM